MDKYKTCEGCSDRSVEPNCHGYCEGYLFRVEQYKEKRKARCLEGERKAAKQYAIDHAKYTTKNINETRKRLRERKQK